MSLKKQSGALSLRPRKPAAVLPKYDVYFDKWTGKIHQVCATGHSIDLTHFLDTEVFTSESDLARQLSNGRKNQNKLKVGFNEDGNPVILTANEVSLLQQKEQQLSEIPVAHEVIDSWDVLITVFYTSKLAVFKYNKNSPSRLSLRNLQKSNDTIDFYIIEQETPDRLLDKISISISDLVNEPFVVVDISDLLQDISVDRMSILTRRIAKRYCLTLSSDQFDLYSATDQAYETGMNLFLKPVSNADINLTVSGSTLVIDRPENLNFVQRRLKHNILTLFVTGKTCDHLLETVDIDFSLFDEQTLQIECKLENAPAGLLCNNNALTISSQQGDI